MGKRTRRRTRQTGAVSPTARAASQQMARVNVDSATWRAFRVEAVRTGTTVATYLGSLVRLEVDRIGSAKLPPRSSGYAGDR